MSVDMRIILVDLDRTLISQDSTLLCLMQLLKKNPWETLSKGLIGPKKKFKEFLIANAELDEIDWKYNEGVKNYIENSFKRGHQVFLFTGAPERVARHFVRDLPIFSGFYSSDSQVRLKFQEKARLANDIFGIRNYDYIADSFRDRHVWKYANICLAPKTRFLLRVILRKLNPPIDLILI